jgi:hypothetical protein
MATIHYISISVILFSAYETDKLSYGLKNFIPTVSVVKKVSFSIAAVDSATGGHSNYNQ